MGIILFISFSFMVTRDELVLNDQVTSNEPLSFSELNNNSALYYLERLAEHEKSDRKKFFTINSIIFIGGLVMSQTPDPPHDGTQRWLNNKGGGIMLALMSMPGLFKSRIETSIEKKFKAIKGMEDPKERELLAYDSLVLMADDAKKKRMIKAITSPLFMAMLPIAAVRLTSSLFKSREERALIDYENQKSRD